MNQWFLQFLTLSITNLIIIPIVLILKHALKDKVSKSWQYYIWLIVVIRLLVPYTPNISIIGSPKNLYINNPISVLGKNNTAQETSIINNNITSYEVFQDVNSEVTSIEDGFNVWNIIIENLWVIWIVIATVVFIQKIVKYNKFVRHIKASCVNITYPTTLCVYKTACSRLRIKKIPNLSTYSKIISPMLIGLVYPSIILPNVEYSETQLHNIFTHELTHYKRRDVIFKWLVQIAVCIHWFNPIVYLIPKEINKNCELACDEVIIKKMSTNEKRQYGNTLLASVKNSRNYKDTGVSLSLNEDAKLLKERLGSIMNFKSKTLPITGITILLTIIILLSSTIVSASAMTAFPDKTISNNQYEMGIKPTSTPIANNEDVKLNKVHPDNKKLTTIDGSKVTSIKLIINTASVNLIATKEDTFRLSYTGKANKNYKVSVNMTGSNQEIATIGLTGKTQQISNMEDLIELDTVTLEIPDKIYQKISIKSTHGVLNICQLDAFVSVSDTNGIISIEQNNLAKGRYSLRTNRGIISVNLDSLLTQMSIKNSNGIAEINFNKEPTLGNFILDIEDELNSVTLPDGWNKYYATKDIDVSDYPSLSINNESGFTNVILNIPSKEDSSLMKTAKVGSKNYFLVETEKDLRAIGNESYKLSDNYMLNNDITLTLQWKAIGDDKKPFTGCFEGNGYTINNLTSTDKKAKYIGLFGYAKGATIHNVTLTNVDIESAGSHGRSIGPIVAIALDCNISDNKVE